MPHGLARSLDKMLLCGLSAEGSEIFLLKGQTADIWGIKGAETDAT